MRVKIVLPFIVLLTAIVLIMVSNNQTPTSIPEATQVSIANNVEGTQLNVFSADPSVIDRGETITLKWDVSGVDEVSIEQYNGFSYGYKAAYDQRYDHLPPTGSMEITLTNTQSTEYVPSQPYIYGASFVIRPVDSQGWAGAPVFGGTSVNIRCPDEKFFFGLDDYRSCPAAPAQTIEVTYQTFEHGFMLKRGDTHNIYAFYANDEASGSAVSFRPADYTAWLDGDQPEFEAIVKNIQHGLVIGFGKATATETHYQATVQDTYGAGLVYYLTLPDGRIIRYAEDLYGTAWSTVLGR